MEHFTAELSDKLKGYIISEIRNSDENDVWEEKKISEKSKVSVNNDVCNAEVVNLRSGKYYTAPSQDNPGFSRCFWKNTIFKDETKWMDKERDYIDITVFGDAYKSGLFDNFIDSKLEMYDKTKPTYSGYQMLRYKKGAKFEKHSDRVVMGGLARLLFIVPKSISDYSGGELIIYNGDNKTIIEADPEKPVIVLLPYGTHHSVNEVTSGARICFKADMIKPKSCEYKREIPLIIAKRQEDEIKKEEINDKIDSLEKEIADLKLKIQKLKTAKNSIGAYSFVDNTMEEISKNSSGKIIPIPLIEFYDDISEKIELSGPDYELVKKIQEAGYKFSFATESTHICIGDDDYHSYAEPTDPDEYTVHDLIFFDYRENQTEPNFLEELEKKYSKPIIFSENVGLLDPEKDSRYNDEYYTYYNAVNVTILLVLK